MNPNFLQIGENEWVPLTKVNRIKLVLPDLLKITIEGDYYPVEVTDPAIIAQILTPTP